MACLGAVRYDPAALVSKPLDALLALTAFDTTNARITFTAPANGAVLVRIRVQAKGVSSTVSPPLFAVLDGATVRGRASVRTCRPSNAAGATPVESIALVTGLTPGNSYTWDAAYCVETLQASLVLYYGGPDNTTAADAGGALLYEVWETSSLIAGLHYDPAVAANAPNFTSLRAMTPLDTTNLRLTFTAPGSGRVVTQIYATLHGGTGWPDPFLGIMEGSTVRLRQTPSFGQPSGGVATDIVRLDNVAVISGLTPGNSYTWDAAYGSDVVASNVALKWGGPNDATANNAFGGCGFMIWEA